MDCWTFEDRLRVLHRLQSWNVPSEAEPLRHGMHPPQVQPRLSHGRLLATARDGVHQMQSGHVSERSRTHKHILPQPNHVPPRHSHPRFVGKRFLGDKGDLCTVPKRKVPNCTPPPKHIVHPAHSLWARSIFCKDCSHVSKLHALPTRLFPERVQPPQQVVPAPRDVRNGRVRRWRKRNGPGVLCAVPTWAASAGAGALVGVMCEPTRHKHAGHDHGQQH